MDDSDVPARSKYPHIAWVIPALIVLIVGIILKANYASDAAACDSGLGVLGRSTGALPSCTGVDAAATAGTTMVWLGAFLVLASLVGGWLRIAETRDTP